MSFKELVLKNRSYRRFFENKKIEKDELVNLVDIARNTNGVLLSPTERNTLESRLYKSVNGMPRNITRRYLYASSKIFDGVERSFNISLQSTAQTVVITNAVTAVITIEL